jgi:hypothetical protein
MSRKSLLGSKKGTSPVKKDKISMKNPEGSQPIGDLHTTGGRDRVWRYCKILGESVVVV